MMREDPPGSPHRLSTDKSVGQNLDAKPQNDSPLAQALRNDRCQVRIQWQREHANWSVHAHRSQYDRAPIRLSVEAFRKGYAFRRRRWSIQRHEGIARASEHIRDPVRRVVFTVAADQALVWS